MEFTGANFVRHAEFPQTPIYGERQLGKFGSHRKGASGSADWFPFYDRCRFVVAKSAQLRFRLAAKTTLAPLLHLRAKSRPSGGCAPKRSPAGECPLQRKPASLGFALVAAFGDLFEWKFIANAVPQLRLGLPSRRYRVR